MFSKDTKDAFRLMFSNKEELLSKLKEYSLSFIKPDPDLSNLTDKQKMIIEEFKTWTSSCSDVKHGKRIICMLADLDYDKVNEMISYPRYSPGMILVVVNDCKYYASGSTICIHHSDEALKSDGTIGGSLPGWHVTGEKVRFATAEEIDAFYLEVEKKAINEMCRVALNVNIEKVLDT